MSDTLVDKTCCVCKVEKSPSNFHKDKSKKDGLSPRCKECAIRAASKWNAENKEKHNLYVRKYYWKNPSKALERVKTYNKKFPESKRNRQSRRRARKNSNRLFVILPKDLNRIYSSPCFICGSTEKITADHIIPIARGGVHSIGNLQPLCASCNSKKGKRLMIELCRRERSESGF